MQRLKGQPNTVDEDVVFQLREENLILEEKISDIHQKLNEYSTKNQSLKLELNTKSKALSEHVTELEEIEMRCTTYFNHLQVSGEWLTSLIPVFPNLNCILVKNRLCNSYSGYDK